MRMMSRRAGSAALSLALLLGACASQAAPPPAPQPLSLAVAPVAPDFHDDGLYALEARLAQYVADGQVKGIATRLVRNGDIFSDMRAGIRREADGAPVEADTIWRIYSMSKPVTGVAMLMLWEEGAFGLDDPLTAYFPEFEGLQVYAGQGENGEPVLVPANRPATIRELMSHTAGFGYGLRSSDHVNVQFQTSQVLASADMQDLIDRVAAIPLLHQPGVTWDYSIAVDLQGALVERLSGMRFGEFLKTRLFDPLGMTDTGFFVPEADEDRFSDIWGWSEEAGALVALGAPGFAYRRETLGAEFGGHGLVSTMEDFSRFAGMLANQGELGGVRILKPETVQMMATNVLPEGVFTGIDGTLGTNRAGGGFGLNVGVVLDSEATGTGIPEGSFMWGGAAGTWFWVDPVNRLYFIGMVQRFGGGPPLDVRSESARLVYEALKAD
jgi:CubicO group peptidase (beta-lactamase class C family)